ncbi:MAG: hypothetical protein KY452_08450 [Actinobacteria bacterium]|nr:hypothetical protein [Actinomycetota bacterium]
MTWSVVTGDDAWADLGRLSATERADLTDLLVEWVNTGPPRQNRRPLLGMQDVFVDEVLPAISVTYFADEATGIVGVLRIRKR